MYYKTMKNIQKITKYSAVTASLLAVFVVPAISHAQYVYPLQVSCHPNTYVAQANTVVVWSASGYGGNGNYTYSWSGTDGLSGNTISVLNNYSTAGTKTASLTVTSSDGQTVTANCGSLYVYPPQGSYNPYYGSLSGSCSANVSSAQVGTTIDWSAYAVGGNGVYTYSWSDSDGYTSFGQYLSRFYTYAGQKNMTLTITSNGESITRTCSVYIIPSATYTYTPTYPTYTTYPVQNRVLAYNDTNTNLSSVYLSDVPYTGFSDIAKSVVFILALLIWSGMLAYLFLKSKKDSALVPEKSIAQSLEKKTTAISKDERDIRKIEDYARTYKILLSSDASLALLKLSRLGKASISEVIQKMAGTDWVAIGDWDIEKYL